MSQRGQTYRVKLIANPNTPNSWVRTLFPKANNPDSAINKVKKFGRVVSCEKLSTDQSYRKIEFIDKKKGEKVIDDSISLSEAIEFKNRIVFDNGFTIDKERRLVRLEKNLQDKKEKYLDELLDSDG